MASVGASTATSTFKAAAGGIFFHQTCCFRASVGENPHQLIWRNETFFQCFWKCFFDEETPFLESCRESKCGISQGNFLHPTPGRLHNPTLRWGKELRCRCGVMISNCPSNDEERTLHYTMTRCRTGFCCWNRWTVASFTPESACFTASATKTCAHVIGKHVHVIQLGMSCDTWAVGLYCTGRYSHQLVLFWISTFLFAACTLLEKCSKLPVQFELSYHPIQILPPLSRSVYTLVGGFNPLLPWRRRGWEWLLWLP